MFQQLWMLHQYPIMGAAHQKREEFNLKGILWQDIQDQEREYAED